MIVNIDKHNLDNPQCFWWATNSTLLHGQCMLCVCKNVGVLFLLVCVLIPQLLGVDIIYCSNINNVGLISLRI